MVSSAGSSQRDIVARIEDDSSFGEYSVILDLSFADGGAVVGEDDKFSVSRSEGSQGRLISYNIFSTLDDETESAVDVLGSDFFNHSLIIIIIKSKYSFNTHYMQSVLR